MKKHLPWRELFRIWCKFGVLFLTFDHVWGWFHSHLLCIAFYLASPINWFKRCSFSCIFKIVSKKIAKGNTRKIEIMENDWCIDWGSEKMTNNKWCMNEWVVMRENPIGCTEYSPLIVLKSESKTFLEDIDQKVFIFLLILNFTKLKRSFIILSVIFW